MKKRRERIDVSLQSNEIAKGRDSICLLLAGFLGSTWVVHDHRSNFLQKIVRYNLNFPDGNVAAKNRLIDCSKIHVNTVVYTKDKFIPKVKVIIYTTYMYEHNSCIQKFQHIIMKNLLLLFLLNKIKEVCVIEYAQKIH